MKQTDKQSLRNLIMAGLCLALGVALPQALHLIPIPRLSMMFSPMHIPVLLCGLLCGWPWGLAVGALTPLISSLWFQMPGPAFLVPMMVELATYGLLAGLLYRRLRLPLVPALVLAMLGGRAAYGLLQAALLAGTGQPYTFAAFFTGLFVQGLPGIVLQLVLVPLLVVALQRAGLASNPDRATKNPA